MGGKGVTPLKGRKNTEKENALGDKRTGPITAHRERTGKGGSRWFKISIEVQDNSVTCENALALLMSLRILSVCYSNTLLLCMVIFEL